MKSTKLFSNVKIFFTGITDLMKMGWLIPRHVVATTGLPW